MNVPIIISGGGIIGNYISLRLKRHNIEIVEDFYKEAVVVRLRECIEFPLSDKNNHSP